MAYESAIQVRAVWFTTKGQVVIPSWLRKQFQIEDGTKAMVEATPDGILLKPVTAVTIGDARHSQAQARREGICGRMVGTQAGGNATGEAKYARSTGS